MACVYGLLKNAATPLALLMTASKSLSGKSAIEGTSFIDFATDTAEEPLRIAGASVLCNVAAILAACPLSLKSNTY